MQASGIPLCRDTAHSLHFPHALPNGRHDNVTRLASVCPDCGHTFDRQPNDSGSRCTDCQPRRGGQTEWTKGTSTARGYDSRWRRLSERARALQPFCSDCGSPYDLTTDHTPAAWARRERGQTIRLCDVDVVCRRCNTDRGAARGAQATAHHRHGALEPTPCPVCAAEVSPSAARTVPRHRAGRGWCPMSGQPWASVLTAGRRAELGAAWPAS